MHEVLVNRLGGLSLPRKSVVRLTDRPDMTLDVYRGRKTTIQYNTILEEHDGKASMGGRNISKLRFADDMDALSEKERELEALVESLDKTCTRNKMEVSAEKTELMTNSANGIQRKIKVKSQKLHIVTSFKYVGAVVLSKWL